jgi:hypothetical protein
VWWVLIASALLLAGCSGDDDDDDDDQPATQLDAAASMLPDSIPAPTHDAGGGGTAARDAGSSTPAHDAGTGTPAHDAGSIITPPARDSGAASPSSPCDDPQLKWKSANKTNYTSYPDPGSEECVKYNGCMWAGQFAACDGKKTEDWVSKHAIVAAFPDFQQLELHDLCLRSGSKTIVVTVLDTCGDSDCDGCCTENKGNADELIDVESYTDQRWGVDDGRIEWADLGPTKTGGCN